MNASLTMLLVPTLVVSSLAATSLAAAGLLLDPATPAAPATTSAAPTAIALPEAPPGKVLGEFLAALDSGDPARLAAFHRDRAPADRRGRPVPEDVLATDRQLLEETGGLVPVKVGRVTPGSIEVECVARKDGSRLTVVLEVEPGPPHGVEGIDLRPGPLAPPLRVESLDALDRHLSAEAAADRFSGVALVSRPSGEWARAYGLADRSRHIPNTLDTRFNLGSMNKMFTAVAVGQLVEKGKISLDDTVGKLLPDYPNAEVREKVTVRHLLTHRSGLGSYWNERFQKQRTRIRTVNDYLALFSDEPPKLTPGSGFTYSNSGYIVLGAILEKVTGKSYYDLVRERVFEPAGMTASGYPEAAEREGVAVGYTSEGRGGGRGGELESNDGSRPNRGGPAGGGYSTARDLARFARALLGGKLVGESTRRLLTTPASEMEPGGGGYGMGFGIRVLNGRRVIGHNGGAPGVAAELAVLEDSGEVVVFLTNRDPGRLMPVVQATLRLLAAPVSARAAEGAGQRP